MKRCNQCGKLKEDSLFKGGICKECSNYNQRIYRKLNNNSCTRKYEKTPKGFLMREYRNMQSRVTGIQKPKAHLYLGKDLLSRDEFYKWAIFHIDFVLLYTFWVNSDYDRKLTPTVDRIDSSKGYILSNMEWVTHSENSRRGCINKCKMYNQKVPL